MRYEVRWSPATVRRAREVADDVRLLELAPLVGRAMAYAPGSHINVRVLIEGEQAERSYSLVGAAPLDGAYRIGVQRRESSRGGSRYLWGLEKGDRLAVSTPASLFELRHGRPEYLLVAGGIGITPVLGMAEALVRRGARLRLLYAGRSERCMPFRDELDTLLGDRLELFVSERGTRLDLEEQIRRLDPQGELYVCGPKRLLDAARLAWDADGRRASDLRFETFGSSGHLPTEPFTVHIRDRGRDVEVAATQTLLEALEHAGIPSMYDCRRGECGLCALPVLEATHEVDHRDVFLSDEEKAASDRICTCVSRVAGGRLVIDTGYRQRV